MIDTADNILFRCSSLGHIMTEPQGKSNMQIYNEAVGQLAEWERMQSEAKNKETKTYRERQAKIEAKQAELPELEAVRFETKLSVSCLNHLSDKFISARYGRESDITNRYLRKGIMVEEDSLTLYSRVKRTPYFKNTERKSNKWITGECDVRDGRIIIDTKSSWDIFSFFRAKNAPLDALYWWQVQGYMGLYDCDSAIVAYCLVDTPQTLIDEELKKLWYKLGCPDKFSDDWMAAEQEMIRLCKYDDIPLEDRVHEFFVERDDVKMGKCYERVEDCRKWMNENLFKVTQPILT